MAKKIWIKFLQVLHSDFTLYGLIAIFVLGSIFFGFYAANLDNSKPKPLHVLTMPKLIDPEFRPYIRAFLKEASYHQLPPEFNQRLSTLTFKFGDPKKMDPKFVGYCDLDTITVIVDKPAWDSYKMGTRQSLVDHELGHCLLERHHRHAMVNQNDPVSIMFPNALPEDVYSRNKQALYKELFSPDKYNRIYQANDLINRAWISGKFRQQFPTREALTVQVYNEFNGDWVPPKEPPKMTHLEFEEEVITVPSKVHKKKVAK